MKGLFAIIKKAQSSVFLSENTIEEGLSFLSHRGNNKKQVLCSNDLNSNPRVGLGICSYVALEINQICYLDYIYVIFDGKLNNVDVIKETYPELKHCLTEEEFIAHAYQLLGEKAFSLLYGYWSLILVDTKKEKLYALRDPFGNKPLFYCQTEDFFAFSSEIRPLYQLFPSVRALNLNAIITYLLWGDIVKHKQDFFADIHELQTGNFITYSYKESILEKNAYYILSYKSCLGKYEPDKVPELIETIKYLFLKGLDFHLDNKTQIAIGLSGGLDSSSICCSARELREDISITAFTAVNDVDDGETLWAAKIVKHVNAQWIKVSCTPQQLLDEIEHINYFQSIPIFNTSSFAQYCVMKSAGEHGFTNIIDGQGSDEMFAGYTAYFQKFINELFFECLFLHGIKECKNLKNANLSCKMISELSLKEFIKEDVLNERLFAKMKRKSILQSLNPDILQVYFHTKRERIESKDTLNDYLFESYTKFLPHILRWGEHSAASAGMDCLMPFSDNRSLTEYVFNVPSIYKIHKGWGKYLLRNAMEGIVPDDVRMRKQKMGFYTPEGHWLQAISNQIKNRISAMPDKENVVNKEYLFNHWDDFFNTENIHFQQFAFRCLSYLVWRNTWE